MTEVFPTGPTDYAIDRKKDLEGKTELRSRPTARNA